MSFPWKDNKILPNGKTQFDLILKTRSENLLYLHVHMGNVYDGLIYQVGSDSGETHKVITEVVFKLRFKPDGFI